MKYFSYFFACAIGMMLNKLIPEYRMAAAIPDESYFSFDTTGQKEEIDRFATVTTPPLQASSPEAQLERWAFWYNEGDYALEEVLRDAAAVKGASVRAMLSTDSVADPDNSRIKYPKMRIVYDDCKSGQCLVYNYGHLEPKKRGGKWYIKKLIYPNARNNILTSEGTWVLKPSNELPYDRREYIEQWYSTALSHQQKHGVFWPIKMAQAILESDAGKSRLARLANQHFAIKAWKGYKGNTLHNRDEGTSLWRFVAHKDALESWDFHTSFLKNNPRYDRVFRLNPDSMYTLPYKHNPRAFDYQYHVKTGKKIPKLVYHKVNGKVELLKENKLYTFSGLEWAAIELSAASYGTDRKYSIGIMATVHAFSKPTKANAVYADMSSDLILPTSAR